VRRMILILTVAAIMAAMLAVSGGNAWAFSPQPDPPGSVYDGYDTLVFYNEKVTGDETTREAAAYDGYDTLVFYNEKGTDDEDERFLP
jgi:hypothetical protein